MNLQDTLVRIFPNGVIRSGDPESGGFLEVHGLPRHTVPRNCQLLASGEFQFAANQEIRESYLVKTDDFVIFCRMCPAPPDSGYAEFAQTSSPLPDSLW